MLPTLVLIAVLLAQGFPRSPEATHGGGRRVFHEPTEVRLVVGALGVALVTFFAGFLALYAA